MATGMARGARAAGHRIAFGYAGHIFWDHNSEMIFRGNPNIAAPGSEGARDLKWINYRKGNRIYNRQGAGRWIWNYDFKAQPGEMFFSDAEIARGARHGSGFIVVEPHIESWKPVAPNKDWGAKQYQEVVDRLKRDGHRLVQFVYPKAGRLLRGVEAVRAQDFRHALAVMANAKLYLGPEGGLHHGAAAVGVGAVVLFGGFIPPSVTGYATHINITGSDEFCGSFTACAHCREAMSSISVDQVYQSVGDRLSWK